MSLDDIYKEQERLRQKYGKLVKRTRWIECKYCYKNTRPIWNWREGLIQCNQCGYGLWPIQTEENLEIYLKCPDFRSKPQWLALVSIRRDLDKKPDKKLQQSYDFFTGGLSEQNKTNFERAARF